MSAAPKRILLLAGEESGVVYAERLKAELPGCTFLGYQDCGFRTADLAVMGFWAVLKRLFFFLRVAREMKRRIRDWRPDAVVTVDYPGLNLKLAAYAKARGIPAVHLVCPQVWAWHKNRIPKVAAALTRLLCFFPFEPALFKDTTLDVRFIGHPLVDLMAGQSPAIRTATRQETPPRGAPPLGEPSCGVPPHNEPSCGVPPHNEPSYGEPPQDEPSHNELSYGEPPSRRLPPTVALLPGSRLGEIQRILPRLMRAVRILADGGAPFAVRIPAANDRARAEIERIVAAIPPPAGVTLDITSGGARDVLRAADCAAVASGTATLEAALAGCPTVLVYAVSPALAWFARRVIKEIRHIGLANVIAEKTGLPPPMPELLQEAFTPEATAACLRRWLDAPSARADTTRALAAVTAKLTSGGNALATAAREVLSCVSS